MRKLTELFAVFSIGLAATLLPGSAFAQQDEDVVRTAPTRVFDIERSRPAAIEGLELIRDLYEDFGGDPSLRRIDIRETRALQLGTPLRHFIVPLDRLQKHDQNGKPIALLKPLS